MVNNGAHWFIEQDPNLSRIFIVYQIFQLVVFWIVMTRGHQDQEGWVSKHGADDIQDDVQDDIQDDVQDAGCLNNVHPGRGQSSRGANIHTSFLPRNNTWGHLKCKLGNIECF